MAVATSFFFVFCLGLEKGRQRQTEEYTLLHKRETDRQRQRQTDRDRDFLCAGVIIVKSYKAKAG